MLRQDKQVLVHWWYYPDRWVFNCSVKLQCQRAKEVVSNTLGLADFAIGLVNSVLNLPYWQVIFLEEFKLHFFQASKCYSPVGTACPNGKL